MEECLMYADVQTAAIISAGMRLLREHIGVIETEIFISSISTSEFDYTKWREHLWEDLTPQELFERAAETEATYEIPAGIEVIK